MNQWFAGNFESCLALCDELIDGTPGNDAQVALLRARALLRLNRAKEALHVLEQFQWPSSTDVAVTAEMLLGAALVRSNEVGRGLAVLNALQDSATHAHSAIRSEIALNRALAYFCLHDVDAADKALDSVSRDADIIYARALEYRGWVACRRADFHLASGYFQEALLFLDTCKHYDRYLEANCAHVLSSLAIEQLDLETWKIVADRREKIDWSATEIQRHRFWIALSAATYAYEIEGADLAAITEARLAEKLAPTPAARVEALCRRAATAGRAEERLAQRDHTDEAYELFASLDPERFEEHDKLVPLVLAKELSIAGRVEHARRVFALYEQHRETSPLLAVTGNPFRYAFERFIEGFVAEASSERSRARRAYLDAFSRFRRIDYKRRAVHAALRLGALLNEPELFQYADESTRHLPRNGWLRQQVENVPTDIIIQRLSNARRDIMRLLSQGLTIDEIAQKRGRSPKTVANAVTEIYRAFNVRNRGELLQTLLRRGIIGPTA